MLIVINKNTHIINLNIHDIYCFIYPNVFIISYI